MPIAKPAKREYDVRSAQPVLFYVGGSPIAGTPATDLSASTLARIAWVRLGPDRPSYPHDVTDKDIAAISDELLATGKYSKEPPAE